MRARLTRLEGGTALRTDFVEGNCYSPELGQPFQIIASALYPETGATGRLVETSTVVVLLERSLRGPWTFRTRSGSEYCLEVMP